MEKQFKISVVVPVYNTGRYLDQLMQSIVMQTIGFRLNIQVVFINDGSTDGSDKVCMQLAERYPENIIYDSLDRNRGVSAARNVGMGHAVGKYITFMDSDDLWSLNAFESAVAFLDRNYSVIDLVSADIEAFEAYSQPHILNQRLNAGKIIDMYADYNLIRVNGPCCIMKTEAARRHRFQEQQCCWEDTVFINQVILEKKKYGMLPSDIKYYYRRRQESNSASQSYSKNTQYYTHDLKLFFKGLYEESIDKCGVLVPMLQYLLAYALAYRFAEKNIILNQEERKQYFDTIYNILQHVDDKYLTEVCNADEFIKKQMLAYKRGIDLSEEAAERDKLLGQNRYLGQRLAAGAANYKVLRKWFLLKMQGRRIEPYFLRNSYNRIAIYGMSDLGQYLFEELRNSQVKVVYGIDRRADKIEADIPILHGDENLPEADVVVVTAVYFYDEIADLLQKADIPVISIEDVLKTAE